MIRIGIIGDTGHWNYLTDALPRLPQCAVVAAADAGGAPPEGVLRALRELGRPAPERFADWENMLDAVRPDIAVIAGPFAEHGAMARAALERSIAVFTEKPAALTLAELDALERAAVAYRGVLYGMMGIRFEPPFHTALRLIRSGAVGPVKLISGRKSYRLGERPEFFFHRELYGGTIPWVGIHAADWIACCGAGRFTSVRALQHIGARGRGTLATAAHCVFALDSGAIASMDVDYMRPSGAATHGDDRLRAAGERGVLEVARGEIELVTDEGSFHPEIVAPPRSCFGQLVHDLAHSPAALAAETRLTLQVTRAVLTAQLSADRNCELAIGEGMLS